MSQATAILGLLFGGLVGWLAHPVVWLVAGPFRWSALLVGIAAQESSFSASAAGEAGELGILQFLETTWTALGGDADGRASAYLSGWYAASYVQGALIHDPRWFAIAIPIYGFASTRYLWTHGVSSGAEQWSEAWSVSVSETNGWGGFLVARSITLLGTWWALRAALRAARP